MKELNDLQKNLKNVLKIVAESNPPEGSFTFTEFYQEVKKINDVPESTAYKRFQKQVGKTIVCVGVFKSRKYYVVK